LHSHSRYGGLVENPHREWPICTRQSPDARQGEQGAALHPYGATKALDLKLEETENEMGTDGGKAKKFVSTEILWQFSTIKPVLKKTDEALNIPVY